MARVNGIALGSIAAGSVFLYAALKGISVTASIQAIISGKSPAGLPQVNPIGTPVGVMPSAPGLPVGPGGTTTNPTGSTVANDALTYVGHCYSFGGAPGTSGRGCWDCSSFVNWVLGHDLGLAIPGYKPGAYGGTSHGPPTMVWLAWGAAGNMTRISAGQVAPGDLVIWQTHMGIATSAADYVSAYDSAEGTVVHPIHGGGPIGEVATFWRLHGTPGGPAGAVPGAALVPHKGRGG